MSTLAAATGKKQIEKALSNGYIVDVTFKRPRMAVTISPQLLGVKLDTNAELKDFFDSFVENNRISFYGKNNKLLNNASNIAKHVHKRKKQMALGSSDAFMTKDVLEDFRVYLEGETKEYMKVRDELVADYPAIVDNFNNQLKNDFLKNTLSSLSDVERDEIAERIMRRVPTQTEFYEAFQVGLKRKKIVLTDDVEADEADEIMAELSETVNEIVGKTLSVAFNTVNYVLDVQTEKGSINTRNRNSIAALKEELTKRNIFDNSFIDDLCEEIPALDAMDNEEFVEELEFIAARIYGYAKEKHILDEIAFENSALSEKGLDTLYSLYTKSIKKESENVA